MTHVGYVIVCYGTAFLLLSLNLILSWSDWHQTVKIVQRKKSSAEINPE